MTNLKIRLMVLLLSILCLLTGAYAQLTPSADAYTNTATPTTNYGAKTLLDVDGATQITYIQFNLSSIPAGASVSQATLKLYVNAVTTAGSFNVDYVNGTWAENTITSSLAPALGATIVSGVSITTASKNQYILINITPAVEAWLNGSVANDGIALVANGTFNTSFDSKENTTTSHPAELDIVFPGGGTITGVTTASGSGLTGGGSSGTLNLSLTNACAANQVLQWNGSTWACASPGTGTITGVTAGADLTGGGTGGAVTLNLDVTKVPQLNAANTFGANQTVNGNLSATGVVAASSYQIGSNLFAYGSYAKLNAFLGFAGNTTMTGQENTASGYQAFKANTGGGGNVATGSQALLNNTTGNSNAAYGTYALGSNDIGSFNTAIGVNSGVTADGTKISGGSNTFVGSFSGPYTGTYVGSTTLGSNAVVTGSNSTAIGYNSWASTSNVLVLGGIIANGATASTNVGIGTSAPISALDVDASAPGALGPTITLTNPGGGTSAATSIDFNSYAPRTGKYNPAARIEAVDAGGWSDMLAFMSNISGKYNNGLQTNMTIDTFGDVAIKGNLSKGGGSFKIDHPLDPANKYLYHSFVESPDMMNIYNGLITLDTRGSVWITLPKYFEALNQDFRYQLTSIGRPQPTLYVAREISGNRFRISGGKPGAKVSWQVTGIRHDAYADAHRIRVEEEKPPQEQGHYLHPELFGAGPEQAVGYHAAHDSPQRPTQAETAHVSSLKTPPAR